VRKTGAISRFASPNAFAVTRYAIDDEETARSNAGGSFLMLRLMEIQL